MPWHIETEHPDCSGFAVIKDSDGSLAGCHDTKQEALDQLAALYAQESKAADRRDVAAVVETQTKVGFVAPLRDVEWRDSGNGADFTLEGHAAVFDSWSEELWTFAGTFRERIGHGAFDSVLGNDPDVRLYYNHDGLTLARTRAGTLELSEDDVGLRVWARVAPTQVAKDLRMAMQRGDVDQMSFAFTVAEDEWSEDHDEELVERTIVRVKDLFDVSIVAEPAYPDTDATMRELRAAAKAGKISTLKPEPQVLWTPLTASSSTTTLTPTIVASAATDPADTDTSRDAGGVSRPNRRLVALRAKGRRARLLTSQVRKDSP